MKYEFQGSLYRTETEMLDALASEYLSAGGLNDRDMMLEFLAETDEKLAAECIECWSLDIPEGDETSWLENRGVNWRDVVRAFARLRANFDQVFPE